MPRIALHGGASRPPPMYLCDGFFFATARPSVPRNSIAGGRPAAAGSSRRAGPGCLRHQHAPECLLRLHPREGPPPPLFCLPPPPRPAAPAGARRLPRSRRAGGSEGGQIDSHSRAAGWRTSTVFLPAGCGGLTPTTFTPRLVTWTNRGLLFVSRQKPHTTLGAGPHAARRYPQEGLAIGGVPGDAVAPTLTGARGERRSQHLQRLFLDRITLHKCRGAL